MKWIVLTYKLEHWRRIHESMVITLFIFGSIKMEVKCGRRLNDTSESTTLKMFQRKLSEWSTTRFEPYPTLTKTNCNPAHIRCYNVKGPWRIVAVRSEIYSTLVLSSRRYVRARGYKSQGAPGNLILNYHTPPPRLLTGCDCERILIQSQNLWAI
jgi:hypothetical protein